MTKIGRSEVIHEQYEQRQSLFVLAAPSTTAFQEVEGSAPVNKT